MVCLVSRWFTRHWHKGNNILPYEESLVRQIWQVRIMVCGKGHSTSESVQCPRLRSASLTALVLLLIVQARLLLLSRCLRNNVTFVGETVFVALGLRLTDNAVFTDNCQSAREEVVQQSNV
jgi:hypothetical protein